MSDFQSYSSELLAEIPELGMLLAQRFVNRAWRDIRESKLWSWLLTEGVFTAPNLINAGTVTVTQYSNTVTLDATANAALNNLTNPLVTSRQFRGPGSNGGVYSIAAYDNGASIITLDRIYQEQSMSGGSYQVYQCYYRPADANGNFISDFLEIQAMKNPDLGYNIDRKALRFSQAQINALDPYRADQGYAFFVSPYKFDTANNVMIYELWPHPVYQSGYVWTGRRRGTDFSLPTDAVPGTFLYHPLVERAKWYACMWAAKNQGRFQQLQGVDWLQTAQEGNIEYQRMLLDAKRQDDEMTADNYIPADAANGPIVDEDMQVSTLLSINSTRGWAG